MHRNQRSQLYCQKINLFVSVFLKNYAECVPDRNVVFSELLAPLHADPFSALAEVLAAPPPLLAAAAFLVPHRLPLEALGALLP